MRGINWKVTNRSQGGSILMIVCGALLALSPDSASAMLSVVLGWVGFHRPGRPVSDLRLLAPSQSADDRIGAGPGAGRGCGAPGLAGGKKCPADQAIRRNVDPCHGAGGTGVDRGRAADPVAAERVENGADPGWHRYGGLRRLGAALEI